jgi:hypothetical protein
VAKPVARLDFQTRCIHELWHRGNLAWKIGSHHNQRELYHILRNLPRSTRVVVNLIARRYGKSFLNALMSLEDCIQNPGVTVLTMAPSLKHASSIMIPIINQIMSDAPPGLIRPTRSDHRWRVANGSQLILGSFDYNVESLRGLGLFSINCEETGFVDSWDEYEYIIDSILFPTLLKSRGRITHFTTPPPVLDHPFNTITVPQAEVANALFRRTIEDNDLLTREDIDEAIRVAGGMETDSVQREYFVRPVRDKSLLIVPEFDEKRAVKEIVLPRVYFAWVGGDFGGVRDKTAIYYMVYDFERDVVQVVDGVEVDNKTPTSVIAAGITAMEAGQRVKPTTRWLDGSGQTLVDLAYEYKISGMLPDKEDIDSSANMLRTAFTHGKIEIAPHLTLLIATLRSGTFNRNRTDYQRSVALGHCDAIAALVYGYRMRIKTNPYVPGHGLDPANHFVAVGVKKSAKEKALNKLVGSR